MVFNFFNRWAALLKSISARNAWARSPQLLRPTISTEFSGSSTIFSPPTGFPSRINASLRCSWDVWIISLLVEPSSYLMFVQIKDCSFWNDASVLLSRLLALTVRYFYRAISIGDLWAKESAFNPSTCQIFFSEASGQLPRNFLRYCFLCTVIVTLISLSSEKYSYLAGQPKTCLRPSANLRCCCSFPH